MIKIDRNSIYKGELQYEFDSQVRQVVNGSGFYVVLTAPLLGEGLCDNIFCLDEDLKLKWKVSDPDEICSEDMSSYELMFLEMNSIKAIDKHNRCVTIDTDNGCVKGMAAL